jgi:hypothetical protein
MSSLEQERRQTGKRISFNKPSPDGSPAEKGLNSFNIIWYICADGYLRKRNPDQAIVH